jgi:hypothetical protein|tara:strand:+ start:88288 stop:90045 length:1758 start_codon:yes stop_codon:yes gene_type:complete
MFVFPKMRLGSFLTGVLLLSGLLGAQDGERVNEIFPLSEVEKGQSGIWRTVVQGDEIREFKLKILGVVDNFAGPGQPVILAEALDAEHILSGPVAGMSGSPVFIDGRIVGAYAYGYIWPKEQALIGITPIEKMLEILDFEEDESNSISTRTRSKLISRASAGVFGSARLEAVPSPMMLAGFGSASIEAFRTELEDLGFVPAAGPVGAGDDISLDLRPGAAVAGVLMQGDFQAAATGTITWTDGDQLLAFGHPFLQSGSIDMPMAGADIITVVRNLKSSFKLANIGPAEGSLFQDRLTGVAGRLGEVPEMADLSLRLIPGELPPVDFNAEIWPDARFLPVLSAMTVIEASSRSLFKEEEQSFRLQARLVLSDGEELQWESRSVGSEGANALAQEIYGRLNMLLNNPFEQLEVASIEMQLEAKEGLKASILRAVRQVDASPRAGEPLGLILDLHDYRGNASQRRIEIPIPEDFRSGQKLLVTVADAEGANRIAASQRRSADGVGDLLEAWADTRPQGYVYVFIGEQRLSPGIDGQRLPGLPPSFASTFASEASNFVMTPGGSHIWWETRLPVEGIFLGQDIFVITLE